jgi:DNA primase
MRIQDAKEIDITDYLSGLGIIPARISKNNYWYHSPFRTERTPSFKVNRKLNRWYDFGEGKGGNLIDFGTRFYECDVRNFLQRLSDTADFTGQQQKKSNTAKSDSYKDNPVSIKDVHPIKSNTLINYLNTRKINLTIAKTFLQEVEYCIAGKNYYALGFKNDSGGYELRNQYSKLSSSPKDFTFINNNANELAVFEGFFNFLSYKNMYYQQLEPLRNFLILNSVSFFEKSLPKMQGHQQVHLYLDNDKTGQKFTQRALDMDAVKFKDRRDLYKQYDDLNDWLQNIGNPIKEQMRQKL